MACNGDELLKVLEDILRDRGRLCEMDNVDISRQEEVADIEFYIVLHCSTLSTLT